MTLQARQQVLNDLEAKFGAPVLSFVTGDRPALATQVAAEQLVRFPRHLTSLGKHKRLALLLYTRGGETHAAWPMVNFIREFCEELLILVPFYAHSAGTLMALGGDSIFMTKFATLSPIDPTVANPFNPQDPMNPVNKLPIAVEDVMAFFELSKRQGAKKDADMAAAFERLAQSVHPLALGNVQRSIDQIRQLAEKMIRLHSPRRQKAEVDQLIHRLTTALYSHFHLISRHEAAEIGLPIKIPDDDAERLLLSYYDLLCQDLQLLERFDPIALLVGAAPPPAPAPTGPPAAPAQPGTTMPVPTTPVQAAPTSPIQLERAYIESKGTCDAYVTHGSVSLQPPQVQAGMPPQVPSLIPTLDISSEGWDLVQ